MYDAKEVVTYTCLNGMRNWSTDLCIARLVNMDPQSTVSQLSCFVLDFQEPYWLSVVMMFSYVLLPYSSGTPLFDERFVDYGYNKVQLIEHLRAANFKFYILNHAFAMDLPHPEYFVVFFFYVALHSERSMLEGLLLCYVLIGSSREKLNQKYNFYSRFPICSKNYVHSLFPLSCVCTNKK